MKKILLISGIINSLATLYLLIYTAIEFTNNNNNNTQYDLLNIGLYFILISLLQGFIINIIGLVNINKLKNKYTLIFSISSYLITLILFVFWIAFWSI